MMSLLLTGLSSIATNYYINPSSDSAKETGSITTPWKNFDGVNVSMKVFKPGDTIFLKRGELYYGSLHITCSGTPGAPIVFTNYGTAAALPVILFNSKANNGNGYNAFNLYHCHDIEIYGLEITDDRIDPLSHEQQANISVAINIDSSESIRIKKMNISLVGIGVNMAGNNNTVDSCKIHNLRMVKNTVDGDDDYGANPIVLAGSGNTVVHCFFKDCWANSYDYRFDGGAIEVFGNGTSNNKILNNTAINCDGFMEIGSLNEGVCNDNLVAGNTIINCGELVYISTGGKYRIMVNNLQFSGNIIIHSINQLTMPTSMIGMQTPLQTAGMIRLNDNVFWLTSGINLARKDQFINGQLIHNKNIFYMSSGELNFEKNASELLINSQSPEAKKLLAAHTNLPSMDYFPLTYLINALMKFIF